MVIHEHILVTFTCNIPRNTRCTCSNHGHSDMRRCIDGLSFPEIVGMSYGYSRNFNLKYAFNSLAGDSLIPETFLPAKGRHSLLKVMYKV